MTRARMMANVIPVGPATVRPISTRIPVSAVSKMKVLKVFAVLIVESLLFPFCG
jgi:hypothetical protein